jgi:hypothetical protein
MFIAAMMRISASVNARQVSAVIRNMVNGSKLRPVRSIQDAVRDSTVPGWDSSEKWHVTVSRNLPAA